MINLFLSFGYFSDEENIHVLKNFYEVLRYGGHLVMDTVTKEVLEAQERYEERRHKVLPRRISESYTKEMERYISPTSVLGKRYPSGKLVYKKYYDSHDSVLHTSWQVILEDGREFPVREGRVKIYSIDEITEMLTEAGFRNIELYFNWYNKPFECPDGEVHKCMHNVVFHARKFKHVREILSIWNE